MYLLSLKLALFLSSLFYLHSHFSELLFLTPNAGHASNSLSSLRNTSNAVEHPVFFYMPELSESPASETEILQGLFDLKYSNYSNLYFLQTGSVLQSEGVAFTHALVSRFPSVEALEVYYQSAITDIASEMTPWLQREYCVDYEVLLPGDAISLVDTEHMFFYIIFIKVYNDTLPTTISSASQAFLSLGDTLDYIIQLTTGENLYLRESYRTMSHAFSIYLPSMDALEKLQEEPSFLSVLNNQILPIAQSYAIVSFTPFLP